MSNINVRIWEDDGGSDYDETLTLVEQDNGTYKCTHYLADSNRVFIKTVDDPRDLATWLLVHIDTRK